MPGQKSGGTKKHGRNSAKCKKYAIEKRKEKSHVNRIRKHIRDHPKDEPARDALKVWEAKP